ncbi:DUF4113 domain-containing protein, partial [Klebsiella pneumoniae]|uniref:DUF4113 domain-containing protein n=1 Tax=Klebsiella pneumoniae TaxID=573 RepID=UPI001C44CB29
HNSARLMQVLDQLNAKNGRGALYFAGQGIQQQWQMKREMLSPRYTTRYGDLLRVFIDWLAAVFPAAVQG